MSPAPPPISPTIPLLPFTYRGQTEETSAWQQESCAAHAGARANSCLRVILESNPLAVALANVLATS